MSLIGSDSYQLETVLLLLTVSLPTVWNGFACLSNPCVHGVCLDDLNSTYFCYCIDGYTGIQCQTNWNECWSSPCQNGGICIDGIAMFNCSCPPGYVGDLCEEDFNECQSNPCLNNGTCIDASNGYTCNCLPGYSGIHCEIDVAVCNATNETRCLNGGACIEGPGETFTCSCQPGWGGFLCDTELEECMSAPCQNGAICIDLHASYACACLFGFTGQNCEEVVQICDHNPCKNGALCLIEESRPTCYCVPDFHGDLCQFQYDECQLGPRCLNGGTCIDGIDNSTCSCPPNLTGVRCECLILGDHQMDCTYIATTTTPLSPETTEKQVTYSAAVTSSTVVTPKAETTQVPNITTTVFSDDHITSTTSEIYVNTTLDTSITTVTETELSTYYISTTATTFTTSSSTLSTLEYEVTTATNPQTSQETVTATEYTTRGKIPETITQISEVLVFSTTPYITTKETVTTPSATEVSTSSTSTVTSIELTTPVIIQTRPPNITTWTVFTPFSSVDTTVLEETTTVKETETNRTFPEVSTLFPTVTTFMTEQQTQKYYTEISTIFTTQPPLTTTESIETTTFFNVDCTILETSCQNGGTCIYTGQGHKCLCPFDAEGNYCEKKLGIREAAFSGHSYLSYRLLNFSKLPIEFEAKTLSNNGLMFYLNIYTTYMALYVKDGFLRFKFSCGYQSMLLSELKIPVNNGDIMNIKANLEFSKDFKHCDATIKINDSLSMTGDQIAKFKKLLTPIVWLHLGGIPPLVTKENIPVDGFVGCISNLKISDKKFDIYKDAEDGNQVYECSSLACLSNPCKNGASCSSHGDIWSCQCRNGYLGKMCEFSICDNNPCLFGGTCIPFSSSGYICLCPYGKHGHFCENDFKINEPHFSSTVRGWSSYAAYPLPEGISNSMEIRFRFTPTTMEQIAILIFIGQSGVHDFYSDHLVVSFVKGYIMLTWNLGSGPRRIFTSQPLEKGARDYFVHLGYLGRRAWLFVENLGNVTGRSPGTAVQLDTVPQLFLGGHDSRNFSLLPHDLPMHSGFSGCIFDVEIKSGSIIIPIQGSTTTMGRSVGQCGTTECYDQSCQNGGACLHHGSTFMCLCQDNWYGPLCSSKNNLCDKNFTKCSEESRCVPLLSDYECDCPIGKIGKYCEKEENITDVSLTGKRSFLSLKPRKIENSKFNMELEIRILKDEGILLFIGNEARSFICLSVHNSVLELRIHSNKNKFIKSTPLVVRSSKLLVKGLWHKVQFGIFGRKMYLYVDHIINVGVLNHGYILTLSEENIFIGGLPDISLLPSSAASILPTPYTGCVRLLSLDDQHIPLIPENIESSRNIVDCDGTPCGGEACQNGGTCWLDSFMKPHCSCVTPFYGEKCENIPDCTTEICKNHGMCHGSKCFCNLGYEGAFCQKEIKVTTPLFTGKSYLIVKKLKDKKRNIRDVEVKRLYVNFTTSSSDGILIWSKKENTFIGVGLEKGYIKLAYSPLKSNKKIIQIPSFLKVNDGFWHNIEIAFAPFSFKIDKKILRISNKHEKLTETAVISTNGVFYIGGLPTNRSLIEETSGLFPQPFEGCIESFASDSDKIISDFSLYEGTNINVCKMI